MVPGCYLADFHLQLAGVGDLLAIEFGDHVANRRPALRARRIGLNLRDDGAVVVVHVKELRVLRRHVGDANAHAGVAHFAVADQRVQPRD